MKKICSLLSVFTFVFSSSVTAQIAPASFPASDKLVQVGIVAAVGGVVSIDSARKVGQVVESGAAVFLGDEVQTDAKGQLQILLLDETVFTIGPNSRVVIDEFVYDPATSDGKIDARIVEGAFRLVTGKIGRKQPSNISIKLPSGEVGIRGTILYGVVDGAKSDLLLLGPGEKNNTQHRDGKILVSNDVNGSPVTTEVKKSGFGSSIPGDNQAPTPAFQLSDEQLDAMTSALNPKSDDDEGDEDDSGGSSGGQGAGGQQQGKSRAAKKAGDAGGGSQAAKSDADQDAGDGDGGDDFGGDVGELSGQAEVDALGSVEDVDSFGDLFEGADDDTTDATQDSLDDEGDDFAFAITALEDLQNIEYSERGDVHFHAFDIPLYHNGTQGGTFDFEINIDYDTQQIGGNSSGVWVEGNSGFNGGARTLFNIPAQDFSEGLGGLSIFFFEDLTDASACSANCQADVTVALFNDDVDPAQDMLVAIEAVDNNNSGFEVEGAGFSDGGEQSGFFV